VFRLQRIRAFYRGADKSLARPGRKQATATEDFDVHVSYLLIIIGGILVLYIASNEIFSPSNKIHREVGRAKDLPAPQYTLRSAVFWEVKPRSLVYVYRHFKEISCLCHQGT
jgi:hypothetical protein